MMRVVFHAIGEQHKVQVEPDWRRDADAEDVAILRLDGPLPDGVPPLLLGSSARTPGHGFKTFGFPNAKPVEGMTGRCEVIGETTEHGFRVLQMQSNEVTVGFSGAPVRDEEFGTVVGMVTSIMAPDKYGRQQETAFITPVETLRTVCPLLGLPEEGPYRGLQVFDAKHADFHFGREGATRDLLRAMNRQDLVILRGA